MKECKKQVCMIPLPNGKFQLTETGIISAQEDGFEHGWKAALKWVFDQLDYSTEHEEVKDKINKELSGE